VPKGQKLHALAGLPQKTFATICGRRWKSIKADMDEALGRLLGELNPRAAKKVRVPFDKGFLCTPHIHFWSVGGVPHPDALCKCGRRR
jgi:hypothetical protein